MRSAEQLPLSSKMAANRLRSTVDRLDPDNDEGGGDIGKRVHRVAILSQPLRR